MTSNDLPSEILIYVQKIRIFFEKNKGSNDYFLKGVDEELFYKHFIEISVKNLTERGSPELSIEQLELLNKTVRAIYVLNNPPKDNIWWSVGYYGKICLN